MITRISLALLVACSVGQMSFAMQQDFTANEQMTCTCNQNATTLFEAAHYHNCLYHCSHFLSQRSNPNELVFHSNFGSCFKETPLQRPAYLGNKEMVALLFAYGAQVNIVGYNNHKEHHTALFAASLSDKEGFFEWLLNGLSIKCLERLEKNPDALLPFFAGDIPAKNFAETLNYELCVRTDAFGRTAYSMMKEDAKEILVRYILAHSKIC